MTVKDNNTQKHPLQQFYKKPGALIVTAIIVVIGAVAAVVFLLPAGERINSDSFQVVYMVGGQAYFGKLQNTDGNYLVLKQPYTAQSVSAPSTATAPANKQASTTLVKVSEQTYGPEDAISLRSDQVQFWQNLRSDSKVVKALEAKQ